jgi:hypothetical protein
MRNNEIIIQFLSGSTVVSDESLVVGVSMDIKSEKTAQDSSSVLKNKQIISVIFSEYLK